MPMTRNPGTTFVVTLLWPPAVTRPRQHLLELGLDHRFDEPANALSDPSLDRIKPIIEKLGANI
jgi:hypothetical protein